MKPIKRRGRWKEDGENTHKGLSRTGRRRGQPQKMANEGRSRVQVEGAISKAPGRARCATQLAIAASLRIQPPCSPADLSGDGCRGKRRRHQACDVGGQPSGLPGVQLQTSQRRRIGTRLSMAHQPRSADRDLKTWKIQVIPLRVFPETDQDRWKVTLDNSGL